MKKQLLFERDFIWGFEERAGCQVVNGIKLVAGVTKRLHMKERNDQPLPQEKDRHLDVPAEANRDKHINFLDTDDDNSRRGDVNDESPFYVPGNTPLKREVDKESSTED